MYGTNGTNLLKFYGNTTATISSKIQTALDPMGDPIRDKQALKIGIEATLTQGGTLEVTVDSETSSSPPYTLSNYVQWLNNFGNAIPWANATSTVINWGSNTGFVLYKTDAQQWGKYLGMTITSTSPGFTINGLEYEHELRARF